MEHFEHVCKVVVCSKKMTFNGVFEIIDASKASSENIAPFLQISKIDTTFLAVRAVRFDRSYRGSVSILHNA